MSYFVSKIGHMDPRFYSLIYCAIPGVQMSGVQMSYFVSKIGHMDPRFYSLIYCAIPGVQMSGVQMSDFISKIGHLDPASTVLYTVQYRGSRCTPLNCMSLLSESSVLRDIFKAVCLIATSVLSLFSAGLNKQFIVCSNSSCMDSIDQERHHLILPLNHCRGNLILKII